MDRRKFLTGCAGNLLAAPLAAWSDLAWSARAAAGAAASLAGLAANTARNLGPYASAEVGASWITDYSSITLDPVARRMCLFGGGHGPSQETDIRVFDLAALSWSSLYAPTDRTTMTAANGDSDRGLWVPTRQPYARHSYNMSLVVGRRFYLMTALGMPDHLDGPAPSWGGRICWYDFGTGAWTYSQLSGPSTPWYYAAAAALDPVSGRILVVGPNNQAGLGRIWTYDPAADVIATGPPLPDIGYSHDLIYFPPNDRFYVIQSDGRVWELALDRSTLNASTIVPVSVSGARPSAGPACGFAYDTVNRIIGGNPTNGTFYAYDPPTRRWTAMSMAVESGSSGVPNLAFYCLEFDPSSGCFVFLSDVATATTWAYRYAGAAPPATTGVADLGVTLDLGADGIAVFSGASAVDTGDFVGEFVRQKSYLATNPAYPDWRVWFRVDADGAGQRIAEPASGWRDEVIVEYGRSTHGTPTHRTTPYTATITKQGATLASYAVPRHWWYARWRHQSSVRPVVRTPSVLKARGWIASFGAQGLFGLTPNTNAVAWDGPMSAPADKVLGAFSNVMGAAGDNPQIGLLTEYAADYVINGSAPSLVSLRTEGEWCGNWCMHVRDDATGAVLDVRNGKLRYAGDGGTINGAPVADPVANPSFVDIETAHFYPCANLPWLLTDDPFFLEELQFACNWQILYDAYHRTAQGLEGLDYPGQTRAFAWGLRDLFQLAASCPASVPAWLRPKSYWLQCIDDNKAFALRYVNSPARIHALFRTWTRTDQNPAWQSAWLNTVVGIAVGQGFADWKPVFDWGIDLHIQQTNGTSGWSRQWPVPYYFMPNKAGFGTPSLYYGDTTPDATTCTSWADLWAYYRSGSGGHTDLTGHTIDTAGWDGHTLMQQHYQSGPSYFLHLRAALAVAARLGTAGARGCHDYIQGELAATTMRYYNARGQARFSIDAGDNYQGLWWNAPAASESGWGINLAHQDDVVFATWFTYDVAGAPLWLAMTATRASGNAFAGTVYRTSGPAFSAVPFDPKAVTVTAVGSATLSFTDAATGTFSYAVDGIARSKSITPMVFASPVPSCSFGAFADPALATNFQDLWWSAPSGSESGWGLSIAHQGDIVFAVWYTYNAGGTPLWLAVTAPQSGPGMYGGTLYRTTGPPFDAPSFDPAKVAKTPVGTASFAFADGNHGTFSYSLYGVNQTKPITRQVFRAPGTACR